MATYLLLVAGGLQPTLIRRKGQIVCACYGYDLQLSLENEAVFLEQPRALHFMGGLSKASSEEPHSYYTTVQLATPDREGLLTLTCVSLSLEEHSLPCFCLLRNLDHPEAENQ